MVRWGKEERKEERGTSGWVVIMVCPYMSQWWQLLQRLLADAAAAAVYLSLSLLAHETHFNSA